MPRRGAKRPTIRDVAERAGVSRGTVSRYLNGGTFVSPQAARKVEKAIAATGYVANHSARSLATGRAGSIGFLLTEPQQLLFEDPNFSTLYRCAAAALAEHDLPLVLMVAGSPSERRQVLRYIEAGHVDGVLLVSSHEGNPVVKALLDARVPTVACGRPLGFEDRMGYVAAGDRGGGPQQRGVVRQRRPGVVRDGDPGRVDAGAHCGGRPVGRGHVGVLDPGGSRHARAVRADRPHPATPPPRNLGDPAAALSEPLLRLLFLGRKFVHTLNRRGYILLQLDEPLSRLLQLAARILIDVEDLCLVVLNGIDGICQQSAQPALFDPLCTLLLQRCGAPAHISLTFAHNPLLLFVTIVLYFPAKVTQCTRDI